MSYEPSFLGNKIRILRAKYRIKQKDLAEYAGIRPMTLSRLEHGELQDLKGQTVARIADKLGVSMDELYGRNNAKLEP